MFLFALLALPAAAEQLRDPGEEIDNALAVTLPAEGLEDAIALAPALLGDGLAIPTMSDEDGWWCAGYEYQLSGAWVGFEVLSSTLSTSSGRIDLDLGLELRINESSDPFRLDAEALCINTGCEGWVKPFPVDVSMRLDLDILEDSSGVRRLDATVRNLDVDYTLRNDDIVLKDCTLADIESILNFFGESMVDLVLDAADEALASELGRLGPELESAIEEAFKGLSLDERVEVGDAVLWLGLEPASLNIDRSGVEVVMAGSAGSGLAECMAAVDPGGSLHTGSPVPDDPMGAAQLRLSLGDDFLNQVLYALWRGGLFCQELDSLGDLALTTSFLPLLAGDAYEALFDEDGAMLVSVRSAEPPRVAYDGAHDLEAELAGLGVDFVAEVDGRLARVLGLGVDAAVGLDVVLDEPTGLIEVVVDLEGAALDMTLQANELVAGADADVEARFAAGLDELVGPMLEGLVADLAVPLGSVAGVGLTELGFSAGGEGDWLLADATVGSVPYTTGCDSEAGGCGGCEGDAGCTTGRGQARWWLGLIPVAWIGRRRR